MTGPSVFGTASFTPPALGLALAIGFVHFRHVTWDLRLLALTIFTFVGVLCVLAVAEEFFFRGLLQQQLRVYSGATSPLDRRFSDLRRCAPAFDAFPNWKFALLATFAGIFYGRAYIQARSIRAAMVTHALVVTTMKLFYRHSDCYIGIAPFRTDDCRISDCPI